ncbi:Sugar phosphate isomerase/epimerase [Daejeonella lutea]|uniref:Sugar phosphate isomerase/epimerase n=2 Tax=Daejeonella lutea TaxID=572036 RepID=A0A1T5AMD2_9SPHI|nr:Sugar phosphate isomerase/epimerase [Daejeonella lutea]
MLAIGSSIPNWIVARDSSIAPKYPPVGLQVYTLGFLLNAPGADTRSILKQIADIGIKEIETATGGNGLYYGQKPKVFAEMAKDTGLKWIGNHIGGLPRTPAASATSTAARPRSRNLRDNIQEIVDDAAEGGCSWVICSSSAISTLDEIKRTAEVFVKAGDLAEQNNMRFAYHNHQSEFDQIEGVTAFDYVLTNTDKKKVFMELDLAWATAAGQDPVALFKKYPGRFPLWHVKDLDKTTGRPCPVGTGKVDFKHIFTNSKLSGVEHTFIEQDGAKNIDDPASSVQWLKNNIYK